MTAFDGGLTIRDVDRLRRRAKRRRAEQAMATWRALWPWAAVAVAVGLVAVSLASVR